MHKDPSGGIPSQVKTEETLAGLDSLLASLLPSTFNTQHSARSAKEFNISSARNVAPLPFPAQGNKNNDVYYKLYIIYIYNYTPYIIQYTLR